MTKDIFLLGMIDGAGYGGVWGGFMTLFGGAYQGSAGIVWLGILAIVLGAFNFEYLRCIGWYDS